MNQNDSLQNPQLPYYSPIQPVFGSYILISVYLC